MEEAEQIFLGLIPIEQRLGDIRSEGQIWSNLANVYTHLGRLPEALQASRKALDCDDRSGNHRGIVANNNRISGLLLQLGRPVDALSFCTMAESLASHDEDWIALASVLSRKAAMLFMLSRDKEALEVLEQARESQRRSGSERQRIYLDCRRAEFLLGLGRPAEALPLLDELLGEFERMGEEGVVTQLLHLKGNALHDLGRTAQAERVFRLGVTRFESLRAAQRQESSRIGVFASAGSIYSGLSLCLIEQGRTVEAWATAEKGKAKSFTEALRLEEQHGPAGAAAQADSYGLKPVQDHLRRASAVLVQYTDPSLDPLCAFVITPDSILARILGPLRPLAEDARTALSLMAEGAPDSLAAGPLGRISARILAPIVGHIPPGATRLYIVPPSALSGFPFEPLPVPGRQPDETVGSLWAVSYLPSASSLPLLDQRHNAETGMVVFSVPKAEGMPELRSAGREARLVASSDALILAGPEARKEYLGRPEAMAAAVLHFASHAQVSPWAPETSALLLAGENGRLTAADVSEMKIEADLVTLSACRTGGGYTVLGEGTVGLSRSFLLAGARSVVTSLWDVEDSAAADFMELFYAGLRGGRARDEALRQARLEMQARGAGLRDRSAFVLDGIGHHPVVSLRGVPSLASSGDLAGSAGRDDWRHSPVAIVGAAALLATAALAIETVRRRRMG